MISGPELCDGWKWISCFQFWLNVFLYRKSICFSAQHGSVKVLYCRNVMNCMKCALSMNVHIFVDNNLSYSLLPFCSRICFRNTWNLVYSWSIGFYYGSSITTQQLHEKNPKNIRYKCEFFMISTQFYVCCSHRNSLLLKMPKTKCYAYKSNPLHFIIFNIFLSYIILCIT